MIVSSEMGPTKNARIVAGMRQAILRHMGETGLRLKFPDVWAAVRDVMDDEATAFWKYKESKKVSRKDFMHGDAASMTWPFVRKDVASRMEKAVLRKQDSERDDSEGAFVVQVRRRDVQG